MPNDLLDPLDDEIWGETIYGEEIMIGETDIVEVIDGYLKPDEFDRYINDNSTPVDTEERNNDREL